MLSWLRTILLVSVFFIVSSCSGSYKGDEDIQQAGNNSNIEKVVRYIDEQEKEWLATKLKRSVETQLYWGKNKYLDTAYTYTYRDSLQEERYKLIFLSDEPNMNITFIANDTLNKSIMIKPGTDSSQVNYLNKGKIIYSKNISFSDKSNLTFLSKEEEVLFVRLKNAD